MRLGIMQPYFFPYLPYWQLIEAVDRFIIYDDVNYIKGGWINRNQLLMSCEARLFTLPVTGASPNRLVNEIELDPSRRHVDKLLKTLDACYRRAPYYSSAQPVIEEILTNPETNLSKFLEFGLRRLSRHLGIRTEILVSSDLTVDHTLKGEDRVIAICQSVGAQQYANAAGGRALYSKKEFESKGIRLEFLESEPIRYLQYHCPFVPNLSIIDVLMFNSVDETHRMLDSYDLS